MRLTCVNECARGLVLAASNISISCSAHNIELPVSKERFEQVMVALYCERSEKTCELE